ncbi:MAG: hypothetical protein K9N38_10370 [Candidatus Marinimicrobia bacterium]|nr:hypothetical protein [Candidatus Neomarinimicrobiota bacterium]MCF7851388.1 hypothetical protein [Candidatus Neomarinimicrobiota bacterium]
MKKLLLVTLVFLFAFSVAMATDKRVNALGNNAYMLPGDDASIGLFPQRINDMNLVYFRDIHLASPDYLLVVGAPGNTWGFYGGTTESNDYFNVIRSLGTNSAVRLGVRFGINSQTDLDDNKESPAITDETKYKQTNIMVDVEYGMDRPDMELSTSVTFGRTPDIISASGTLGSFESELDNAGTKSTAEGSAARTSLGVLAKARSQKGMFIFDNSYAIFSLTFQGESDKYDMSSAGTTTNVTDEKGSIFSMSSTYGLFNNQDLADGKVFLVYGMGGTLSFSRQADEGLITGSEYKDTYMSFGMVAPIVNLGLEAQLKYAALRFGMQRTLTMLGYSSTTNTYVSGTTDDEDTSSLFTLGGNGSYTYNAGMGFNYGPLTVDILINNSFWITGPQMIFDGTFGALGICADLVYTF